jgi:hypothetical protein
MVAQRDFFTKSAFRFSLGDFSTEKVAIGFQHFIQTSQQKIRKKAQFLTISFNKRHQNACSFSVRREFSTGCSKVLLKTDFWKKQENFLSKTVKLPIFQYF